MMSNSLLDNEISKFKKASGIDGRKFSLKNRNDYLFALEKAFNDAFNQYARRKGITYKNGVDKVVDPIIGPLFDYFNNAKPGKSAFDKVFDSMVSLSTGFLKSGLIGLAYKFSTMAFKYLFCYEDASQFMKHFEICYMPLDRYTLNWVKKLGDKGINKGLACIDSAFSKIDKKLFSDIQNLIIDKLKKSFVYDVSFATGASGFLLPEEPLKSEFIIWHQEKLIELHKTLIRNEDDFERLGIKKI